MKSRNRTKFIFVTGGVVSSLGKGIVAASCGALLETRGLKVTLMKADPYINVDPGTMNPSQHGEVFVTEDGAETDLDIGHYERFTSATLNRQNSFSAGQVYDAVLNKERRGDYLGGTVQVIPHITDQIKENIYRVAADADIAIVEIGGTVGDIEGLPFLEAIRQIRYDLGDENVLYIHLTLVPYIKAARELKTKPTQHSVKELRQIGIQPNLLICRSDQAISKELKKKIALFCNVKPDCVFEAQDLDSIYKLPVVLHDQGFDQVVVDLLNIWTGAPNLSHWHRIVDTLDHPRHNVKIGIVGKYVNVWDSYKSITESLTHAGIYNHAKVEISLFDAAEVHESNVADLLDSCDGVIVPGGFGERGVEGKMTAIHYLRRSKKPFLGICLGMQLAAIEFARNKLGLLSANSQEFEPKAQDLIIHIMEDQKSVTAKGGTMRLGGYPCVLKSGSKVRQSYNVEVVSERHRHRFEFNNHYREVFEAQGMVFSGLSPDGSLVEVMELTDHPWFVSCQFHPELKSKPMSPHPLFRELVRAALTHKQKQQV
ncbi:MAG: CTP synthase [Deltaproteobacteria bacterium]|nr:CTP synthase [Deltaproteobacteria bacterium]